MQTYDFIIGYENKVRELESVCLVKMLLEKKGYSVYVFQEFDQRFDDVQEVLYHARVLILSCGYTDAHVAGFVRRFITFDKLVNWQWEQMFSQSLEFDPDSFVNVQGSIVRQAVHFAWGDYNEDRLTGLAKIPREKVMRTGMVSLDYVRPEFARLYKSREEIQKQYGINENYKIAILIGAFQGAFMSQRQLDEMQAENGADFSKLARENRERFVIEMNWIRQALLEDERLFFIYRPHPGEEYDRCPKELQELLDDMVNESKGRFIFNQDYTVRQWIMVADKLFMGFSTTMVDAYFAGKGCALLSPAGIPNEDTGGLFEGARETASYEDFKAVLDSEANDNPLRIDIMEGYFGRKEEGSAYIRVIDALERVYKDDSFLIDFGNFFTDINKKTADELSSKSLVKRLKLNMWKYDWFYDFYWNIMSLPIKSGYFDRQREYKEQIDTYYKSYIGSQEEMDEITARMKRCLEG